MYDTGTIYNTLVWKLNERQVRINPIGTQLNLSFHEGATLVTFIGKSRIAVRVATEKKIRLLRGVPLSSVVKRFITTRMKEMENTKEPYALLVYVVKATQTRFVGG